MVDFKQQLSDLVDKAIASGSNAEEIADALNEAAETVVGGAAAEASEDNGGEPEDYAELPTGSPAQE